MTISMYASDAQCTARSNQLKISATSLFSQSGTLNVKSGPKNLTCKQWVSLPKKSWTTRASSADGPSKVCWVMFRRWSSDSSKEMELKQIPTKLLELLLLIQLPSWVRWIFNCQTRGLLLEMWFLLSLREKRCRESSCLLKNLSQ